MSMRRLSDDRLLRFVGNEISRMRRRLGLSQENLAGQSGIHRNSLGRIERGECDSSIVLLSYLYFNLGCQGVRIDARGVSPLMEESACIAYPPEIAQIRPPLMVRKLATAVHARRDGLGLTLQRTAETSSIHLNTLWNFENGLVCPTITTYFNLLRTLEVSTVTQSEGTPLLS